MFGTVEYFYNYLKDSMMNNLFIDKPCTLQANYALLTDEIMKQIKEPEVKEKYSHNLERAFKDICEDLLGLEEKDNGC